MYRGTTPNLIFNIKSSLDLTTIENVYISIKSKLGDKYKEYDISMVTIDAENSRIILPLSQLDTLYFKGSKYFDEGAVVYIQMRIKDTNGNAYASAIITETFDDILKDGVI